MAAVQRRFRRPLNPAGSRRVYSSPGLELILISAAVPSLLLTVAVGGLLYVSVRSFRRGRMALGALLLIAALSPFILFVSSTVQSILADRERAKPLSSLAMAGPVTDYPDVLVARGGTFELSMAARLMLARGFREVDVTDAVGIAGVRGTVAFAEIPGCREALVAWAAEPGADRYSPGGRNLDRCLTVTPWDQRPPERTSAVVLLQGEFTAFNRCCRHQIFDWGQPLLTDLELRIKDSGKDVLVDSWMVPSPRPMFPLFIWMNGLFIEQRIEGEGPITFVMKNLKK
jgi:hypothetical protein